MAAKVVRLQEPILIVASAKQDKRDAVDAGNFNTVVVQVNNCRSSFLSSPTWPSETSTAMASTKP